MMRARGFTLVEMLISILLTAIVFTYLYATLDSVRGDHTRYTQSVESVTGSQRIYTLLMQDITQMRSPVEIVHEAGYDRIAFKTDHTVYGIPRPWVHYFISRNEEALIRIESTAPVDFFRSNYIGDTNGTYLFADRLATGCSSLRFTLSGSRINMLIRCKGTTPIVATLYKGDQ
ncbi:prepilin-type N-terminal cleavage/methylation domain-containing protein [Hydrogenimonas sp.]|jgi:prepilin-type N-terminal cleavage/methylation domain-containing protein|uniref:PulJ/GspJ family protein n=1 Tax=Hydrogenimonas sp. TaxID=2231112 RepID=UPI002636778A|nr:prepilin-type N-terminal cleavage/methylation domain-containing protein [Hydrogenimonas sp.]